MNKQKNQDGSALVIVMCVLCVLTAIILSMIFAAYQVYHNAQKADVQEQCKQSVLTMEEVLEAQLIDTAESEAESLRGYISNIVLQDEPSKEHEVKMETGVEETMGEMKLIVSYQYEDADAKTGYLLTVTLSCELHETSYQETRSYTSSDGKRWTYEPFLGGDTQ